MATTSEEIRLVIKAEVDRAVSDLKRFNDGLDKTNSTAKSSQSVFSSLKTNYLALAGAIAGAAAAFKFVIDETVEQQKVLAQLDAVLKSTNYAAGLTAVEIRSMAEEMKNLTAIDDETIISGQNLLLTFTNIGKDVFPKATEAMLDMSVALGQDVSNSAIQLGKALQSPVQGVTALRRVGVQLSETQEQQIKQFVALNDVASAQKIILQELSTEFGGSAKAKAETFGGTIDRMKILLGDLAKTIGNIILPDLQRLASGLAEIATPENLAMLGKLISWAWEFGKAVQRVALDVITVGLYEIYNAYKLITDKGTSGSSTIADAGLTAAKEFKPSGARGAIGGSEEMQKAAEQQKQAYMTYIEDFNGLALAKESERYTAMMEYAQGNASMMEEVERQHQENLANIRQEAFAKEMQQFQQKSAAITGFAQQSMTQLSNIFSMQSANQLAKEDANYKKKKMFIEYFIKDEEKKEKALQALDIQHEMAKKTIQRREFERQKGVQIAQATISMLTGAMQAFQSMLVIPIAGIILGGIAAAAVLAFGAAQIAMIAQTQAPAMAEGGLIQGSQSGTIIRAGEGGRSEAIIPLENPAAMEKLGGMGGVVNNFSFDGAIFASQDVPREIIEAIDRGMYKLNREKQSMFAGSI